MTENIKLYKCNFFKKNGYTDNIIVKYIQFCEENPLLKPYGLGKPREGYFRIRVMKQNAKTKKFCDSDIVEVTEEFFKNYNIDYKEFGANEIKKFSLI